MSEQVNWKCIPRNTTVQLAPLHRPSPQTSYPQNFQCSTKKAYVMRRTVCSRDVYADYAMLYLYYK